MAQGLDLPAEQALTYWEQLDEQTASFEVMGSDVESNKFALLGIPFIVLSAHFQSPQPNRPRGYVTMEIVVAPKDRIEEQISYGRVATGVGPDAYSTFDAWLQAYGLQPGSKIIVNDGSTGIRRQIVEMLHTAGTIDVGFTPEERRSEGRFVFDRPWTEWADTGNLVSVGSGENERLEPHFDNAGKPFIKVYRGLKVSKKDAESRETFSLS